MTLLSPFRKRQQPRTVPGLTCPACGGGVVLNRA